MLVSVMIKRLRQLSGILIKKRLTDKQLILIIVIKCLNIQFTTAIFLEKLMKVVRWRIATR